MVILDAATAKLFRNSMRQSERDWHAHLHTDTFVLWRIDRPGGWDDGTAPEGWALLAAGTGKLGRKGAGGVEADAAVIFTEATYPFRLPAAALATVPRQPDHSDPDLTGLYTVVNGTRLFEVVDVERLSPDKLLTTVTLAERFDRPLPGVTP